MVLNVSPKITLHTFFSEKRCDLEEYCALLYQISLLNNKHFVAFVCLKFTIYQNHVLDLLKKIQIAGLYY